MPAPAWEDLDAFLQLDVTGGFAVPAVFTLSDGSTREVAVIFDDPAMDAEVGEYIKEDQSPYVTGKETELRGILRADSVVISGRTYGVLSSPRPDGTGMAIVRLATE